MDNDFSLRLGSYYNNNQDLVTGLFSCGFLTLPEKIDLLNTLIQTRERKKALDLGCGKGGLIPLLKILGYENYTGIDLSSVALDIAKRIFPESTFIRGDIHEASELVSEREYDLILICDVLEHSPDPLKLISDANKLLKVGGIILIVVPNYFNLIGIRKKLKEISSYEPNTYAPFCNERPQLHENFTTSFQVNRLLKNNSFKIIDRFGWDFLTAISFRPPYAENSLKGFWAKRGQKYGQLNRYFLSNLRFLTSFFSMYYIVSAVKTKNIEI